MDNTEKLINELKAEIADLKRRVVKLENEAGTNAYIPPQQNIYDLSKWPKRKK